MLQKLEGNTSLFVVEMSQVSSVERRGRRCTGCKTDHGEKRVGHGEITHYKSRVFPLYLALFVVTTYLIWKVCESHGVRQKVPSERSARHWGD